MTGATPRLPSRAPCAEANLRARTARRRSADPVRASSAPARWPRRSGGPNRSARARFALTISESGSRSRARSCSAIASSCRPTQRQVAAMPVAAERVLWIELEPRGEIPVPRPPSPSRTRYGPWPARSVRSRAHHRAGAPSRAAAFPRVKRLVGRDRIVGARDQVGVGKAGIGRRECRVVLDRAVEVLDRPLPPLARVFGRTRTAPSGRGRTPRA